MKSTDPHRLPALAIGEWLLTLPATILLGAAAVRLLQPRQYEPAHTAWILFEWAGSHISRLGAATLFIALPAVAAIVGCVTMLSRWRQDESLRHDATLAWEVLGRHIAPLMLTAATLLAGAILCFSFVHVITD